MWTVQKMNIGLYSTKRRRQEQDSLSTEYSNICVYTTHFPAQTNQRHKPYIVSPRGCSPHNRLTFTCNHSWQIASQHKLHSSFVTSVYVQHVQSMCFACPQMHIRMHTLHFLPTLADALVVHVYYWIDQLQ